MSKIRILVVEDSLTVRRRLVDVLSADPDLEVIGEAANGQEAIEHCQRLQPDVVSLDLMLPVLNGLEVTEYIMGHCPTPILIVSSSTNRGDLFRTYDALAAGAMDVLEKPTGTENVDAWERTFRATVKLVSRVKVIRHIRASRRGRLPAPGVPAEGCGPYRLVAIGTSTGGPAACLEVLRNLPPGFPLPVLLVIHIGATFGEALAEWLDSQSPIRVARVRNGQPLPAVGEPAVLVAPPDRHLVLGQGRLWLSCDPERHSCRPSVDVLFESVAREMGPRSIACLLTGMGKDGAQGLLAIRRAGGRTLAQDQATSTIFGMPQEAIRVGAAERVLPIHEVAPTLLALAAGANGSER